MTHLHVVVPAGIDDASAPSGGNGYDRRVIDGLRSVGWDVTESAVGGEWPTADADAEASLDRCLGEIATGAVVVLDGLIASAAASTLTRHGSRLRIVTLMHLPQGVASQTAEARSAERAALDASVAVVTTSTWTRDWLLDNYGVPAERVHVAQPGAEYADAGDHDGGGGRLLCVGAVVPHKGQDVLVRALGELREVDWTCTFVGSLDRDRAFVVDLQRHALTLGIGARLLFDGPRTGQSLDAAYGSADVLIVPSRTETYGMVVGEAIAHGLPVVASDVGGLPEALGGSRPDDVPGLLVRPGDASALASALHSWLTDDGLRAKLRARAARRRLTLPGWETTVTRVSRVLTEVAT